MRRFNLERSEDVSGSSGIGIVAQGVEFDNGKCSMSWIQKYTSIGVYTSILELEYIHGHEGRTKVVWLDK